MKNVLIIIPTYNEAQNIRAVIEDIEKVARHTRSYEYNLLIADDYSPDGTAKHVKALQKQYANIHLLSGKKNGLGQAYLRGFIYALKNTEADIFIMMDADLSHDPKDIPALLKAIDHGADYAIGSRYTIGGSVSEDWPFTRRIISRTANFMARKLAGISDTVTDVTGGFKAIRRSALEEIDLKQLNARGYVFQVSLLHAFLSKGFVVQEVPITFSNRQHGVSKLKTKDIVEFVYRAYKLNPDAPIQRIARFGFVGACGVVVNLAVLTFLVKITQLDVLVSAAIAIELSILFNFSLNHHYTFKGYGAHIISKRRETFKTLTVKMLKYNAGALGGAAISFTTFTFLFKFVHTNYILADIIAIGVATSWNYWMSTRFVWKAIE